MTDDHTSAETVNTSDIPEHPLLRDELTGMNPVTLATGFYGARGERIRHQVHEGALRLPELALSLIAQSDEKKHNQEGKLEYSLPGLDSVVRPTVDLNLPQLIVTEVMNEEVSQDVISPEDGTVQSIKFSKTVSRNRISLRDTPTERIRGGGEPGEHSVDEETNRTAQIIVDNTILNVATGNSNSSGVVDLAGVVDKNPVSSLESPTASMDIDTAPREPYVPFEPLNLQTPPVPIEAGISLNTNAEANVEGCKLRAEPLTHSNPPTNVAPGLVIESSEPVALQVSNPTVSISTPSSVVSSAIVDAQPFVDNKGVLHPNTVSSSTPAAINTDDLSARVVPLKKRPPPQWDERKNIGDDVKDYTSVVVSSPEWFQDREASSIERATLGEWFDGSAGHRTPEAYIRARSTMMEMSSQLGPSRYLTATLARRSIPGDAGSLLRMHAFLTSFGLINADTTNETTPAPAIFQKKAASWDDNTLRESLMRAVVDISHKRPRLTGSSSEYMPIDWNAVAIAVGHGTTPMECERKFMSMPIPTSDGNVTPKTISGGESSIASQSLVPTTSHRTLVLQDLVDETEPTLLSTVVNAALCHTNNLSQAQSAGTIGLACRQALDVARVEDGAAAIIMAEIVDLRMRKLESRMELLDEIEGMLEAERVDLELERRDLYTARCRHWFGGT